MEIVSDRALREIVVARPLPLKGVRNLRDLGGYPFTRPDGSTGVTASHAFLRGPALGGLKRADMAYLRRYGLRRVIDVRSNFELRYWPDPYRRRHDGVTYTHIPLMDQLNSSGFMGTLPDCMFDVYRDLLDESAPSLGAVMAALDGEGCALFHCRAGKDRTGVIAMLLLELAGVDAEHIVADYAATEGYMGWSLRAQAAVVTFVLRKRIPRCLFESAPIEMERTLAHLHGRYGSARAYLLGPACCSEELVDRLAARLRGDERRA